MAYSYKNNSNKNAYAKPEVIKVPRAIRDWSILQENVFKWLKIGTGNLQVDAKAGSGKTATLVECTFLIPENFRVLACAFNNTIQQELEARTRQGCVVKTMHSIGNAALYRAFGKTIVDKDKLTRHIDKFLNPELDYYFDLKSSLVKAVNFSKYNLAHSYEQIESVIYNYHIEVDCVSEKEFIDLVIKVMNSCKQETRVVDFADMIWLPIVLNLTFEKFDYVFIDEAQDLNKCQVEIALRSLKEGGRVISFGDEFQAIYSFAGADFNSINNIVARLNSKRLPLSISYRCSKNIIKHAQKIVPSIEHALNAKDGEVIDLDEAKLISTVRAGNVILSRVNAKLISICMKLLKNKIPANIVGRDIGDGLSSLVKKSKAKTIPDLITYVENWREKECEKLSAKEKDCSHIVDKADCIIALTEDCNSVSELLGAIDKLFSDNNPNSIVTCSSIHKFKGKEREIVFILDKTLKAGMNQEESNIAYVAYTRAIDKMYLVR